MASKKQGRAKVQEESLAAQLAEMRGDLSDKDLKEILRSARYERTTTTCAGKKRIQGNILRMYTCIILLLYNSQFVVMETVMNVPLYSVPWLPWKQ